MQRIKKQRSQTKEKNKHNSSNQNNNYNIPKNNSNNISKNQVSLKTPQLKRWVMKWHKHTINNKIVKFPLPLVKTLFLIISIEIIYFLIYYPIISVTTRSYQ